MRRLAATFSLSILVAGCGLVPNQPASPAAFSAAGPCQIKYFATRSAAHAGGSIQPLCNVTGHSAFAGSPQQAVNQALERACACDGVEGAYAVNIVEGGFTGRSVAQLVGFRRSDSPSVAASPSKKSSGASGRSLGALPFDEVAVLPLRAKRVKTDLAAVVDDLLVAGLHQASSGSLRIIGRDDISAMMELEDMKDAMGCDEVSCATEIAGALGVDYIVAGSIGRLGEQFVLALTLVHTSQQAVIHRHTSKLGESPDEFLDTVQAASRQFLAGISRS